MWTTQSYKVKVLKWFFDRHIRWRIRELSVPEFGMVIDYPIEPAPRYGDGKPPHPELHAMFSAQYGAYLSVLRSIEALSERFTRIACDASDTAILEPHWENKYFTALDAMALYALLTTLRPARYVEVGSGNSTKFARRAARDSGLETKITSIDPNPRSEIDRLCDEVVRSKLESLDTTYFSALRSGDFLFVDNSHRAFQNSDVTVFFLEILPRLKPGVIVHIHDIFLPYDYPAKWIERYYSEQYLLAAYLLAGGAKLEFLFASAYIDRHPELAAFVEKRIIRAPLQTAFSMNKVHTGGYWGTSFWFVVQ